MASDSDVWRHSWGDLEALGIQVSLMQEKTVEQGGEVLVLQHFPEPGCYYLYNAEVAAFDQFGNQVFVAGIIESTPADEVCPVIWHRGAGIVTLADWLDQNIDDGWRTWPSYTGQITAGMERLWYLEDVPSVVRVWDGIPIASLGPDGPEVAQRILDACSKRIDSSNADMIGEFYAMDESGELPYDDDGWNQMLKEKDDEAAEHYHAYRLLREMDANSYFDLEQRQMTDKLLEYPSMEQMLAGDHRALEVWNLMYELSRVNTLRAQDSIHPQKRAYYNHTESWFTPWS